MTREGGLPLTNSQEQDLLQELKDLGSHIDYVDGGDPLQFPLLENFGSFGQNINYIEGQLVDDKNSLQQSILSLQQQELMHHQQQLQAQQIPLMTPIRGKEEFAGDFNFQLILNHQNSGKHWVYSEKLSKVFIHMEEVLPLQFLWSPTTDGLWVRATMVYKLDQHRSQPVARCHNHMAPDNNSNRNIDPKQIKHVIRCMHPTSIYEEEVNGHLSVITPLGTPEAGVHNVPMDFRFYCKNSCTSGMNRRPTELIFTLETDQNVILGRRKLEVRVCSCPKRDKEKEENEVCSPVNPGSTGKKRKSGPQLAVLPPPGKKLATDTKVYPIQLNIVGRDNANAVIKYAHDVMAGSAVKNGNYDVYKPYMDEVLRKYPSI